MIIFIFFMNIILSEAVAIEPNEILKVVLCNLFTLNMIRDEKKATKKRYKGDSSKRG